VLLKVVSADEGMWSYAKFNPVSFMNFTWEQCKKFSMPSICESARSDPTLRLSRVDFTVRYRPRPASPGELLTDRSPVLSRPSSAREFAVPGL